MNGLGLGLGLGFGFGGFGFSSVRILKSYKFQVISLPLLLFSSPLLLFLSSFWRYAND